jgi:hypothetical protein
MSEQAEGMAVAALAGVCLFIGLAYMLAYILGRFAW